MPIISVRYNENNRWNRKGKDKCTTTTTITTNVQQKI